MSQSSPKKYFVNEIFYSLQGEGVRAGTANIFLRFSGCNLSCRKETEGFDCDTEFQSGRALNTDEIISELRAASATCQWIVLTGGEPGLQLDEALIDRLKSEGYRLAIETNGTCEISQKIDWICVSPKSAEHTLKQKFAHELKYVRAHGQGIPKPSIEAQNYLISPAFEASILPRKNLQWCIDLVKENPRWRLSFQSHKFMDIR